MENLWHTYIMPKLGENVDKRFCSLLIQILLLRGCIEENPGPSNMPAHQNIFTRNQSTYMKTKGHADMSGELFEIKVVSLLFLRGLRMTKTFYLASNMSEAGVFDDIVFMYRDDNDFCNICFLQLKHKKLDGKKSMISMKDILTIKGDFSLPKYCCSYNKLKQQFANGGDHLVFKENFGSCYFGIYTNASCHKILSSRSDSPSFGPECILNSGGDVFSFSDHKQECVSNFFEDLPRYRAFLCDLRNNLNENIDYAERISHFSRGVCNELRAQLLRIKNRVTADEIDKMINDLDSLGDYSNHNEFLSRLHMFTSQKSEKDLDEVITSEIKEIFGIKAEDDDDAVAIFRQLIEYIQLWWKYENFYLSRSVSFWQNILQTRLNQINDSKRQQLKKVGISFNAISIQNVQKAIATNNFLNISSDAETAILSFSKVYQALEQEGVQYLLVDIDTLNLRKHEIVSLWPQSCQMLVVCFENNSQSFINTTIDEMWESVFSIFNPGNCQKIIVVSNSTDDISDSMLKSKVKQNFREFHDEFSLAHLNKESRESLLKKTIVDFQGIQMNLQTLFEKCPKLDESIDGKTILQLLKGGHTIKVGKCCRCETDYYIPRVLQCHHCINTTILAAVSLGFPCIIAISGFTSKEIFKYVPRGTKIKKLQTRHKRQSSEFQSQHNLSEGIFLRSSAHGQEEITAEDKKNSVTSSLVSEKSNSLLESQNSLCLYLIDDEQDFSRLCEENTNVHWLTKYEHNGTEALSWVKSQGDLDVIYQHLNTGTTISYRIDNILSLINRIVLVIAEAGMGKSTLFTHLAIRTKISNPEMWVLKVNLNDHTNYLDTIDPGQCDNEELLKFMRLTANVKTSLEYKLLEHCIIETGNIAILLDGYDEISPTHATKAAALIECLVKTKVRKVWISSRPIMKSFLEKTLSAFAFTLQPFTEAEQEIFMINFWKSRLKSVNSNVEVFAKKLLMLSTKFLDSHFMGIPLQTMMLAEAYENEISMDCDAQFPESMDLLQLYEQFVEKKVCIYCNEKKKIDTTKASVREDNEYWRNVFLENHILASMMILFPPSQYQNLYTQDAILKTKNLILKIECGHEKTGIINNVIDEKPQFIHRTFADYFAGKCLCILYESNSDNSVYQSIRKYFVSNLASGIESLYQTIFNQDFTVARNIFDRTLAHNLPLHSALISRDQPLILKLVSEGMDINIKDKGGRTPLHLGVCYQSEGFHIITQLLLQGADVNAVDSVLNWRPLRYADKIKAWSAIECLLNNNATTDDIVETKALASKGKIRQEILHVAVSQGFLKLLVVVLQTKYAEETDHKHYEEYERYTLLRTAVKYEQWSILKFLVDKHININSRYGEGETITHWAARQGKPDAISELVKLGADVNIRNNYGNTPLHSAAKSGSLSVVTEIVRLGGDVSIANNDGNTALYQAAGHGMWHIVNHLLHLGSNINIESIGNTPLHWAAEKGELDIIYQLAALNADLNIQNIEGNTPLHWAVRKGTAETIKALLQLQADINVRNHLGETPISYAAKQCLWDKVEVLLKLGANANIRNNIGNVPLHWAAKHGNCDIVKQLSKQSYIDIQDNFGNTPLHFAAGSGKCDIIKQLVELKAPINAQNSTGNTPLHWAAGENKLNAVQLLVTLGADPEMKNTAHNTALHLAAGQSRKESDDRFLQINMIIRKTRTRNDKVYRFYASDNLQMVKLLVGVGAIIKRRNKKGNTPLHLACLQGNVKIVKYLTELKFGINTKNNYGMTPLDLAYKNKNSKTRSEITAFLKKRNASRGSIFTRFLPVQ